MVVTLGCNGDAQWAISNTTNVYYLCRQMGSTVTKTQRYDDCYDACVMRRQSAVVCDVIESLHCSMHVSHGSLFCSATIGRRWQWESVRRAMKMAGCCGCSLLMRLWLWKFTGESHTMVDRSQSIIPILSRALWIAQIWLLALVVRSFFRNLDLFPLFLPEFGIADSAQSLLAVIVEHCCYLFHMRNGFWWIRSQCCCWRCANICGLCLLGARRQFHTYSYRHQHMHTIFQRRIGQANLGYFLSLSLSFSCCCCCCSST